MIVDVFFFLAQGLVTFAHRVVTVAAQNDFRPAQTSTAVADVKVGFRVLLRNRQAIHEKDELRQKQLFDAFSYFLYLFVWIGAAKV